jgi:hypothetical protein
MKFKLPLSIITFLIGTALCFGEGSPADGSDGPPTSPPVAQAFRASDQPILDGDVINDPAWSSIEPITGFWQTQPFEGQPASEETEVRIIFDDQTFYLSVVCYDRDPSGIIVADSRRDSSLVDTDSFQFILDTYHDLQNGFVFGTNPAAIEYDGQVTNEGEGSGFGNRQQTGAGRGFNLNWDATWAVRTQMGDFGWSAEFEIPFQTLRYNPNQDQIWGVNFQRNIRRRNETSFWAPLPLQFNLYRLSLAGTLTGLEIARGRNLLLTPYIRGDVLHRGSEDKTNWLGTAGGDIKYSVTPSLALDGTINTDFAEVEVDELQINLDRFNVLFPEKRPFFLENAGFFAVGAPGEVDLFFSRKIGIGPNQEIIPIIAGARLSGKVGSHYNLGLLNMQTQEMGGVAPSNNFTTVRLSRELPNRSSIGGIFVNRQGMGQYAAPEDYNRTFGFDGRWGIGQFGEVSGFLAKTSTPNVSGDQYAYQIGSNYDSQAWILNATYTDVAPQFNPEVGFLRREDFRKLSTLVLRRFRPADLLSLQEIRPHVSFSGYWNHENIYETGRLHVDNHLEWRSGAELHTGVNFTHEELIDPFAIYPGVVIQPGVYDNAEAQIVAFTDEGRWLSGGLRTIAGGFYGGSRLELTPTAKMRLGDRFNTEFSWSWKDINLPEGDFVANLVLNRISYSFTPRIYIQSLIQYNDRAEVWSTNVRFAWLQAANTGLFIVYNDFRGFSHEILPPEKSLTVKFSHQFSVLE